jgi:hypothetical protein
LEVLGKMPTEPQSIVPARSHPMDYAQKAPINYESPRHPRLENAASKQP